MKKITEKQLFEQNSLTKERLEKYLKEKNANCDAGYARPLNSLIDLISWSKNIVRKVLNNVYKVSDDDIGHLNSYIHNKICIDGQFIQFCEENKLNIKTYILDSIASWNVDYNCEHFIAQGIFEISKLKSKDDFRFFVCSLFHKGNQYEDEVSFFVLVGDKHYEEYIKLRNAYDEWKTERDRAAQEIYVVGGDPISYESNLTWDDLVVPETLKSELKLLVEGFLNSKNFYKENNIPYKRGAIFWGEPGVGKTLAIKIMLSEYGFKPVTIHMGSPNKDQLIEEAFEYAEMHGPSILFFEDFPKMLNEIDHSYFLQLLDGMQSKEGLLVIATANNLSEVPKNLTDRPSRFDRKIQFPLPDRQMTETFLKSKFKNTLTAQQYKKIVDQVVKNNFSFAYLKELFITSAHIAISNNRQKQTIKDVEQALTYLLKDKSYVKTGFGTNLSKPVDMNAFFIEED